MALGQSVDPAGKPRDFARDRVFVDDSLVYAAHQHGLGAAESFLGSGFVTGCDGGFHLLYLCPVLGHARAVNRGAAHRLADAFTCLG